MCQMAQSCCSLIIARKQAYIFRIEIVSIPSSRWVQKCCLTFEFGTDSMSRNVGTELPTCSAQHPIRARASTTLPRKPVMSHYFQGCLNHRIGRSVVTGYERFIYWRCQLLWLYCSGFTDGMKLQNTHVWCLPGQWMNFYKNSTVCSKVVVGYNFGTVHEEA